MKEIWKNVDCLNGIFECSNIGNFRKYGKPFKPYKTKAGYLSIGCRMDGKDIRIYAHRAILTAFIHNPYDKKHVNHKNGLKDDNRIENLEWSTCSENIKHAYCKLGAIGSSKGKFGIESKDHIDICKYDLRGNFIKLYHGFHEAGRETDLDYRNIHAACKGKQKTCGGFIWKYAIL